MNLIPFNPWPGSAYEPSTREQLARFARIVQEAGFASPIRAPRGPRHPGRLRAVADREPADPRRMSEVEEKPAPAPVDQEPAEPPTEIGGPKGPEPTRYGDWEQKGRCTDF